MVKIKNIVIFVVIFGLLVIAFTSWNSNKADSNVEYEGILINNEVYQKLSDEDIEKFIEDNNIEPLGVDTVYNFNTVIIFGDLYSRGYYEVNKKNNIVSDGRKCIEYGDWSDSEPIIFSGGTASGDYPFAVLYILDDKLINVNNYIEIVGESGGISKFDLNQQAYAIETKILGRIEKYTVYDSNSNMLISELR